MKPLPAKGYCRAVFVIEQSAFDPEIRYVRLGSRAYVSGYIKHGHVVFCRWLRKNTNSAMRLELIEELKSGVLGEIEVRLWPTAFPRIYGLINERRAA